MSNHGVGTKWVYIADQEGCHHLTLTAIKFAQILFVLRMFEVTYADLSSSQSGLYPPGAFGSHSRCARNRRDVPPRGQEEGRKETGRAHNRLRWRLRGGPTSVSIFRERRILGLFSFIYLYYPQGLRALQMGLLKREAYQ